MSVRAGILRRSLSPKKTDTCVPFMIVLRDAQEQRAARLEAERKLVEFQEQLKKVLSRQHDPPYAERSLQCR
jgi:hypothetical protein